MCLNIYQKENLTDKHLRWQYLKYEIRKIAINVSKNLAKEENKDRNLLEKELKKLEKKPN